MSGGVFGPQVIHTLAMDDPFVDYFLSSVSAIDQQIALDFRFTERPQDADLRIYFDTAIEIPDASGEILGLALANQTQGQAPFWEIMLNKPAFRGNENYLRYAALHEFGHSLGLEHPFDNSDGDAVDGITDPWNSAYPEETVMAYRSPQFGLWSNTFTRNDLRALQLIWGSEYADPLINGGLLAHDHHGESASMLFDEQVHVLALDHSAASGSHEHSDLDWLFGSFQGGCRDHFFEQILGHLH
ncbi:matrixin family metalloprotease [Prochlorococcus marinus]|uniref:matrixin family metalloprotease n=1 Tax=Prochlorococcus TaxID=1218 RepID=UPI0012DA7502|nr:matrixin family metalloprotease [Prochlorococcus marinus]